MLRRALAVSTLAAPGDAMLNTRFRAVGLITAAALALVGVGPFVLDLYTVNILIRAFLYAATALTVDLLWGYTGILTFGQGAFFGIGAYAAGLTFTHLGFSAATAIFALAAGIAVAVAVAALIGWLGFWHGASPLYVAVVTLVLPIVVVQLLYSGGTFTGSSSGLVGYETFFLSLEAWFWIAGGGLILITAAAWLFVRSDFGRVLVAIREHEQRCQYLGIGTSRIKILLMMAMAGIAATAGYAYACFGVVVAPSMADFVFGTELVIYVALGGRGTLIGPVLGTIFIELVSSHLSGSLPFIWKLIVGTIFVVVIVLLPQGLLPPLWHLFKRGVLAVGPSWGRAAVETPVLTQAPASTPPVSQIDVPALQLRELERHFGSLQVLRGIDLTVDQGELLSIVGPNGAGKTTLMRCISDGYERTGGEVRIAGHDVGRLSPARIVAFDIGRSFQNVELFETLTVAECLRLARYRKRRPALWSRSASLELPEAAVHVVTATGLGEHFDIASRHLSHGMKRALELAMVLTLEPKVLLLDEPTAGLTKGERVLIGSILTGLSRSLNLCILLIEHDLDFVREISSRVVVLHQGAVVLNGSVAEVVESALVRAIYSGQPQATRGPA